MDGALQVVTVIAAVGCGLVGGAFFTFSTFVMHALKSLPPARGAQAMQAVNVSALRPPLMILLFGTALVCVVGIVLAATSWSDPGSPLVVAGAATYLLGNIVVTMVGNVPLNNALAGGEPDDAAILEVWQRYQREWVAWNHVRTLTATAAAVLLVVGLVQ